MSSTPSPDTAPEPEDDRFLGGMFDPEEIRRRNLIALGMDLLILVTVGFLAILFTKGFWASMIAAVPVAVLLYFGWKSSKAFFVAELLAIVLAIVAIYTYMLPY
jgi:hypothetical protein